jgi:hypothetical protein
MKFLYLLSFLLLGCANVNTPRYEPANNEEYIEQYEAQSDQEIKANTLQVYTYAGVALFTAGVAMIAFTPRIKSGLIMLLGGLLAMGSPFIFNTEWFAWVFGVALAIALLDGLYVLFRLTVKYVEEKRSGGNGE